MAKAAFRHDEETKAGLLLVGKIRDNGRPQRFAVERENMSEHLYRWEYTDTFAGEANYCWVRRGIIRDAQPRREVYVAGDWDKIKQRICNAARREAGLAGVKSRRSDFGDMVRYDQGCTVLFVELGEFWPVDGDSEPVSA